MGGGGTAPQLCIMAAQQGFECRFARSSHFSGARNLDQREIFCFKVLLEGQTQAACSPDTGHRLPAYALCIRYMSAGPSSTQFPCLALPALQPVNLYPHLPHFCPVLLLGGLSLRLSLLLTGCLPLLSLVRKKHNPCLLHLPFK